MFGSGDRSWAWQRVQVGEHDTAVVGQRGGVSKKYFS